MIYVISKSTFGNYNVRDIQCNVNWDCCPYSDYALIPDNLVDGVLATKGYCDITLNAAGNAIQSFTARSIPSVPDECCGINTVLSVNGIHANNEGDVSLDASDVGAVPTSRTVNGKALSSNISLSASDVGARANTWIPTVAEVGAAPAGYGLGETPRNSADANAELSTGYFRTTSSTDNSPFNHGAAHVRKYNDSEVVQNLFRVTAGVEVVRYTTDGGATWIEEWVNPTMSEGTEYRTTERINGKAVYKKLTNGVVKYRLDGETTWKQYPMFEYGNSLPAAGTPGRIFFKKVSS